MHHYLSLDLDQYLINQYIYITEAHTANNEINLGALGWSAIFLIILIAAVASSIATSFIKDRKQKKLTAINGSPHYGSYPNQYSSLPTKDVRVFPAFFKLDL